MYTSKIKTPYRQFRKARLCQGDIFRNITVSIGGGNDTDHTEIFLKYAVVVTQDCDLEQDYSERKKRGTLTNDKHLDAILVCPAYPLDEFSTGTHIDSRQMETFNPKELKKVRDNNTQKRYHYLAEDLEINGVPELVIDFKHFFTVPRDILYAQKNTGYITTVNEIYREALSQRFANFLSRIGLPDNSSS